MRVLHWYWQTNAGGIHQVVSDLIRTQREDASLEVRCVVGKDGAPCEPEVSTLGLRHGFDFLRYGAARRALEWADLVHMHGYNPVIAAAVARLGKPCVYTDHGSDRFPSLRNRIVVGQLQRRFVRDRADLVTVNSSHKQGDRADFYGIDDARIRVVHNGLDFHGLARADLGSARASLPIPLEDRIVGTVAVFNVKKRIHLLLEAFAELEQGDVRLLVVGDGAIRQRLERRARALGIAERTLFTGYCERARELIALMDVFVLPTRDEGFGLAAVEALALRRPVIVFKDGGGLTEIVRDGETGFVVKDVAEATRRIRQILGDADLATRLGDAGADDVRARFSIDAMAERTRRLYDEALAGIPLRTA